MPAALFALLIGLADEEARCPEPEAVQAALRNLGSRENPERIADAAARAGMEVDDLGDGVRVHVGERQRDYPDPGRDCERRARLAAVFAALVLAPEGPDGRLIEPVPAPAPPPLAAATIVSTPSPAPAPVTPARLELGAGPSVAFARHHGSAAVSAGVSVGAAREVVGLRFAMAIGLPLRPADVSIGGATVALDRYPLRLTVGRTFAAGRWRAVAEAGAVGSMLRVERTGPPPVTSATRFEVGAHLGAELALATRRVSVYTGVSSDWIPRTYPITLDPEGEVDRTPGFWLAAEAGLRFTLH